VSRKRSVTAPRVLRPGERQHTDVLAVRGAARKHGVAEPSDCRRQRLPGTLHPTAIQPDHLSDLLEESIDEGLGVTFGCSR
jgi:hypothetical protein